MNGACVHTRACAKRRDVIECEIKCTDIAEDPEQTSTEVIFRTEEEGVNLCKSFSGISMYTWKV